MIHRFIENLPRVLELDIPILVLNNALSQRSIWKIGNGLTPDSMGQTIVTSLGTPQIHLGDPEREPTTGDSVVYSRFTITGTITREVRLVDWDDTTDIQLYNDTTGGVSGSCEPTWAPDGSKILFRAKGAGSNLNLLKTMNPDGTGVTTIYTGGAFELGQPTYSPDGTKIAWQESNKIMVANSDGTSPAAAFTASGSDQVSTPAWQRAANVIGFQTAGAAFTSNELWRKMNADGTSLATWLTISRASGYGASDADPVANMWSWTSANKIATTVRVTADPDPDSRLGLIDSGGMTYLSPARYGATNTGAEDLRPVALTGRSEGVERVWWLENPGGAGDQVSSVLTDGSGYRLDFKVTNATFHGFRGSTQN